MVSASRSSGAGSIGSNSRLPAGPAEPCGGGFGGLCCWRGVHPAKTGSAAAAVRAPAAASRERRLSCFEAISANRGSVLLLGAGYAHALPHLRWHVTALRLP